ncbi:MAG TPA: hypothetical protein PKD64_14065 [Pirellulaceae bacterium]|nr:hypothetical protein [Pirellulaceae bacterium]HMP69148.1 hypothetical protein [Pirellulaceae bacterium]
MDDRQRDHKTDCNDECGVSERGELREHGNRDDCGNQLQRQALVQRLQRRIEKLETSSRGAGCEMVSAGSPWLDGLLPAGGLPRGTLIEWFAAAPGCGSEIFSLIAARSALANSAEINNVSSPIAAQNHGVLVVIDPQHTFYPVAAAAWGIDLERTIVVRHPERQKIRWAIQQSLSSPAVSAVWGYVDEADERWLRRFQLAAEEGRTLGLFHRPSSLRRLPNWSEIQWWVEPQPLEDTGEPLNIDAHCGTHQPRLTTHVVTTNLTPMRCFRLHLFRCRGGVAGKSCEVQFDLQTGQLTRYRPAMRTFEASVLDRSSVQVFSGKSNEGKKSSGSRRSASL